MSNSVPWVDKYRPKKLDEIVSQEEVTKMLNQTLVTGQMPHLLFYGSSGTGKCLALDTPVIMYDGSIKMVQNVEQNDLLMGDDNTSRKVLNLSRGKDVMYKITQSNGNDYVVNSEHILSLKLFDSFLEKWDDVKQSYKLCWLEDHREQHKLFRVQQSDKKKICDIYDISYATQNDARHALEQYKKILLDKKINKKGDVCDISVKDYLNKSDEWKYLYRGFKCGQINCWKKKETDIDAYLLGYWLNNESQQKNISAEILHDSMDRFSGVLNKYGMLNDRHIPFDYKINDVDTRMQLLAGYLDADDYLRENQNFGFRQKSKKLFDDIVFISRSLGFIVSIRESEIIDDNIYYRANIHGNGIENIPTKIKNISKYKHNKDNFAYKIDVEKLNYGDYYGFEIDGNKRFLLGDFTVTHNTSTILAVAYQLFGPKIFKERVIELNASDERGINIVRHKINTFARMAIGNADENYPCPPFKLIILDEADAMTTEAQSALRKVMEELSGITRFCFICNYKNQIIDPIVSRCMKFRFKPVDCENMYKKLDEIAIKEKMNIMQPEIKIISEIAKGDVRKGIMILQNLKYVGKYKGEIKKDDIYKMTGQMSVDSVIPLWNMCHDNKMDLSEIIKKINKFKKDAIPIMSILENLQKILIDSDLDDKKKSLISIQLSETETCIYGGADEYLQMIGIFSYIYNLNRYGNEAIIENIH